MRTRTLLPMVAVLMVLGIVLATSGRAAEPHLPPALLRMARDPVVHRELGLSPEQASQFLTATDRVDPLWWPSRILPSEEQSILIEELTARLENELQTIMDDQQRERLAQLRRQAYGTRMLLRSDVEEQLGLSADVREQV